MDKRSLALLILLGVALVSPEASGRSRASRQESEPPDYQELAAPGKKIPIDDDFSFVYEFVDKPRIGIAILRVRVLDAAGHKASPFKILGRLDMPSMSGAHDSGDQEFKLNKKNDYLLPVNIVMPGEWEVRLAFYRDGKPVFRGAFRFDV